MANSIQPIFPFPFVQRRLDLSSLLLPFKGLGSCKFTQLKLLSSHWLRQSWIDNVNMLLWIYISLSCFMYPNTFIPSLDTQRADMIIKYCILRHFWVPKSAAKYSWHTLSWTGYYISFLPRFIYLKTFIQCHALGTQRADIIIKYCILDHFCGLNKHCCKTHQRTLFLSPGGDKYKLTKQYLNYYLLPRSSLTVKTLTVSGAWYR